MDRRDFSLGPWPRWRGAVPADPRAHAQAIGTLKMMIPANPGGGWDQTGARARGGDAIGEGRGAVQFENKAARRHARLAQFVNSAKGDPNALMMAAW